MQCNSRLLTLACVAVCSFLFGCVKSTATAVSTDSLQGPSSPRKTVEMTNPNGPGGIQFDVTAVIPLTPVAGGYEGQITDNAGDIYFVYFASQFEYLLNTCGAPANGTITSVTSANPNTTRWVSPVSGIYTITTLQLNSGTCAVSASQTAATQWENAAGTWDQNYSQAYQSSPATITTWLNAHPQPQYESGYLGPDMQSQCDESLGDLGAVVNLALSFRTVVYSYVKGVPQFAIVSPFWIFKGSSCGI